MKLTFLDGCMCGGVDFGGEVERIMNMVDGVLLVVDAVDGPKPQTRFVLRKALEKGVKAIVVINKIDRPQSRPDFVLDRVFDLFAELNASDEQMDFQVVYASGIQGVAGLEPDQLQSNLFPLFDEILKLPKPQANVAAPLQMLIANIDYDEFKGKMGIGRIVNGALQFSDDVLYGKPGGAFKKGRVGELFTFNNVGKQKVSRASAGDIVMLTGIEDISIGDTVMSKDSATPLPPIVVEEPTVRMTVGVNKSPLAGREGKQLQSRVIRDRLFKELERNVALKVYETENADTYEICGRGQLHLTVLLETMRREGFELLVGPPMVIERVVDGVVCEPFELVDVTTPTEYASSVVDMLNKRRGEMQELTPLEGTEGQTSIKFIVPTRGMIGVRSALLTATKGTVLLDTVFDSYRPVVGGIQQREKGSLLATEDGTATPYGLFNAQERGRMFIQPKEEVYKDMIIGAYQRPGDLYVNVCKAKQLTNMRAAGSDENIKLVPPMELSLDIAVEYIQDDELVELTPTKVRMLKHPQAKEWARRRKAL